MSAKSVTIIEVTEPPYCQYNGQYEAQDVYIEIDPDGKTVSMDYDPEIGGGVPEDVYHKIIMRYYLPRDTVPTVSSANDILSNLLPLAERVVAGHSIEWNGIVFRSCFEISIIFPQRWDKQFVSGCETKLIGLNSFIVPLL